MTICVVYSPTPEGEAALDLAVREARVHGARLVALATGRQERFDHEHGPDEQALRSEVELRLSELRAAGDLDVEVRVVDDGGDAAGAVIDLAVAADAERIVVGVKRRSPVGKLLTGSVGQRIILESPVPVLVTHAARG